MSRLRSFFRLSHVAAALLAATATLAAPARADLAGGVVPRTGVPAAQAEGVASPDIAARSWLLVDLTSGQVLAAREPDQQQAPASLTKMMTAYLTFKAIQDGIIRRDQMVRETDAGWHAEGSRMFIDPRVPVSVDDLLYGLIVVSGNDAAVTLAQTVAGTQGAFVSLMNRQAQAWGLSGTHFADVNGLPDPAHHSTARDLAVIASHIIRDFPSDYARYFKTRTFTYNKITQPNRVSLLFTDPSVDGLKTGYVKDAGYCMVTSAQRAAPNGPRRLLAVVLGADSEASRVAESEKLLNWGFQNFDDIRLSAPGRAVATARVWKGAVDQVGLGSPAGIVVSVPRGAGAGLRSVVQRPDPLVAPIARGQALGTLQVSLAGKPVGAWDLQAVDAVPSAGAFKRAWDSVRMWIR